MINRDIKRVLMTGATGMIGVTLINRLIENDIKVTVIVRPGSKKRKQLPKSDKVSVIEADLSQLNEIGDRIDGQFDAFYHLGWDGTYGESRNDCYVQNQNVKYTIDAVHLAGRCGCKVFVGTGSQAEYGRTTEKLGPDTPVFPENGYGIAKLCAGQLSRIECEKLGIDHVWTRILSIYGPFDGPQTMIMSGINKMLDGVTADYTKGEQMWDYLYSKDAANALYLIAKSGVSGKVYMIGSGQVRPLAEYITTIRDSINPDLAVNLGTVPYAPRQVMYLCANIDSLMADTGFKPMYTFEEGIKETINWCMSQRM